MADPLTQVLVNLMMQSLLAIGGIYVVLGEMHRVVVGNGLIGEQEFTALFALAQAMPGPNMQFVTLIGWRLGGFAGGIAATLAFIGPAMILAALVARLWDRWGERRWFVLLRAGIVPLTIGLMLSSAWLLTAASAQTPTGLAVVAGSAALSLRGRLHPLGILAVAGALGALGLV